MVSNHWVNIFQPGKSDFSFEFIDQFDPQLIVTFSSVDDSSSSYTAANKIIIVTKSFNEDLDALIIQNVWSHVLPVC